MFYHPFWDGTLLKTQLPVNESIRLDFTFQTQSGKIVSYNPYEKDFEVHISKENTLVFQDFFENIPTSLKTPKDYEKYIRSQAWFSYSIDNPAKNFDDFLYGSKQGHCEYFASLLTLTLQNAWYKATLVTGFRDWEYNELANSVIVRAKHAHAWTEVYDETTQERIILDATPPNTNISSELDYKYYFAKLREIYDYADLKWYSYVVNYTSEEQKALFLFLARNIWVIFFLFFILFLWKLLKTRIKICIRFIKFSKQEKILYLISKALKKDDFSLESLKNIDKQLAEKYENFAYNTWKNISYFEVLSDLKKINWLLKK
jgi:hypothetical protein